MATSVGGVTTGSSTDTQTGIKVGSQVLDKDDFLRLLVAQIKNQNPLNPADGVEFLSQLAQFSQLEQLINISSDVKAIGTSVKTDTASESTTSETDTTKAV